MNSYNIGIGIGRIKGIEKEPYYLEEKDYFIWKLKFSKISTAWIYTLPFVYLGKTIDEANEKIKKYRGNLKNVGIYEDEVVAVMFDIDKQNEIMAISFLRKNVWIDIKDSFNPKKFSELDINIESLTVY